MQAKILKRDIKERNEIYKLLFGEDNITKYADKILSDVEKAEEKRRVAQVSRKDS